MKKKLVPFIIVMTCAILFAGCMSAYDISSDPTDATVLLDGNLLGTTPTRVNLPANTSGTITVKKDGYDPSSKILSPTGGQYIQKEHFVLVEAKKAPVSFIQTMEPSWASIEIRDGIEYENAWNAIADLLIRRFDMEVLSKDNGYMRTTWLFSWTGQLREDYRVRVTVKFSPDHKKVDVKSEANYQSKDGWVIGSDTALLQTLKTDLMGTVGRVTR